MTGARAGDGTRSEVLVGLMSGTSADGISAAAVRFDGGSATPPNATLLAYHEQPYAGAQRDRLLRALDGASLAKLARLDFELGAWLADAALAVIGVAGLVPRGVRAIASHGHTIWHEAPLATWQIGQSAVIAERTGIDVISDFRVRDVAAGHQEVVASDGRHAFFLFGGPIDRDALANHVVVANDHLRVAAAVTDVLRLAADDHAGPQVVVLTKGHAAHQRDVVFQSRTAADASIRPDHAEGTDLDVDVDLGAGMDRYVIRDTGSHE